VDGERVVGGGQKEGQEREAMLPMVESSRIEVIHCATSGVCGGEPAGCKGAGEGARARSGRGMKTTHLDSVFATRERRGRDICPGLAVEETRGETHCELLTRSILPTPARPPPPLFSSFDLE
jgi:hypothetical protein